MTLRARVIGKLGDVTLQPTDTALDTAPSRTRRIWIGSGWTEVPVLRRGAVLAQHHGPLVIEEDYSVLWIGKGWTVEPASGGDLIAQRTSGGAA